ncbi:hypothetical protein [Clostridium kluyveri]|uniref:hypothetical protein n=1 Tax=Clostridium kluyveri TaxID=1534 RepID=UPI0018DDE8D3|nr:hypothetical protein [Clostridium kluyveri]
MNYKYYMHLCNGNIMYGDRVYTRYTAGATPAMMLFNQSSIVMLDSSPTPAKVYI